MLRSAGKEIAARPPALRLPELAYFVLGLNPTQLPLPAVKGQFQAIRAIMPDPVAYYEQYQPLITEEVIAIIRAALDKEQTKKDYLVQLGNSDRLYYYPQDDVSMLTLAGEDRIDCTKEMNSTHFIVAAIPFGARLLISVIDIFFNETRVILKGDYRDFLAQGGSFKITPLSALVNLDRMYNVCQQQPDSALLRCIRTATVSPWPSCSTDEAAAAKGKSPLNALQQHAADSFASAHEGLYLLQGPPGTGKTTTIVEMLRQLTATNQPTLVCAPSNKAVQVLASRALTMLPDEPILLTGVGSKVPTNLQPIFWDNWIECFPQRVQALLTQMDVISQLSPSDDDNAVYPRGRGCIDLQRLSVLTQQLSQDEETIKRLLSGCLRYATQLSPENKNVAKQNIAASLAEYSQLLSSLQKLSFTTSFPELGKHVVKVELTDLESRIESLQLEMRACYNNFSSKISALLSDVPKTQEDLLANCSVLFCTLSTTGRPSLQYKCSKRRPFLAIIIDEAGQTPEAENLIPFGLAPGAQKMVLVGDPRQLPATTIARSSQESNFEWSMLWRLLIENKNPFLSLQVQYRMRAHINHFPSYRYYEGNLLSHPSILQRFCHSSHWIPEEGISWWVNINGCDEKIETSYINRSEALAVVELVKRIRQHDQLSPIGVISFYGQQVLLIRKLLSREPEINPDNTLVSTVDGFQGDQKKIIIVSLVRANNESRIGFLQDFRRLNVSITRAEDALLIVGDERTYRRLPKDQELGELLDFHRQTNGIIPIDQALARISGQKKTIKPEKPMPLPAIKPIGPIANPIRRYREPVTTTAPKPKPLTAADLYNADELIRLAQRLFDQMNYEGAIEKYNTALQREPQRADVYEHMADCYDAMEEAENAKLMRKIGHSLKEGAKQHPQAVGADSFAARVKIPVAAVIPAADRFITVSGPLKKKIKDGIAIARKLSDNREFSKAEKAYQGLLDLDAMNSEVLLGLGWTLYKQRKTREAVVQFERSLKVNKCPLAYCGLIQCKNYLGERGEALDLVYEALDDFPWSKVIHRWKHDLEAATPRAARSSVSFFSQQRAAPADPPVAAAAAAAPVAVAHSSGWAAAAVFNSSSHGPRKLQAQLLASRVGAKKISQEEIAHVHHLSQGQKRPDLAEAACLKLLEREPNHAEILREMGWALLVQRKNREAIPCLIKSLSIKEDPSAYYGLARGYFYNNQKQQALTIIEKCLTRYPHGALPVFDKIRDFKQQIAATTRVKTHAGRF